MEKKIVKKESKLEIKKKKEKKKCDAKIKYTYQKIRRQMG